MTTPSRHPLVTAQGGGSVVGFFLGSLSGNENDCKGTPLQIGGGGQDIPAPKKNVPHPPGTLLGQKTGPMEGGIYYVVKNLLPLFTLLVLLKTGGIIFDRQNRLPFSRGVHNHQPLSLRKHPICDMRQPSGPPWSLRDKKI